MIGKSTASDVLSWLVDDKACVIAADRRGDLIVEAKDGRLFSVRAGYGASMIISRYRPQKVSRMRSEYRRKKR